MRIFKKFISSIILLMLSVFVLAQDTSFVQTFTFDSITTRRGIWDFPDTTHKYRKILMEYTLKCDPATTQDGYNCGEWDYLTYTFIHDHTGVLDSNYIEHQQIFFGNGNTDSLNTCETVPYNIYVHDLYHTNVDSIHNNSVSSISIGNENLNIPFEENTEIGRTQFLWRADTLLEKGLIAGNINRIAIDISQEGNIDELIIRFYNTTDTVFEDNYIKSSYTEVYRASYSTSTGSDTINFYQPFYWDGSSNIVVEFAYSKTNQINNVNLLGYNTTENTAIHTFNTDKYIKLGKGNYINVPTDQFNTQVNQEITISFWAYGNPNEMPHNSYVLKAYNSDNEKVLICHLPWSDSNVYWDAGCEGNSFDRIYKTATMSEISGRWNHWALVKNSATGSMKIYLNGELWHSGTGLYREITDIEYFHIGGEGDRFYNGYIDEFQIWNKELSSELIQEYMNKSVDTNHPYYSNLIAYYKFDDNPGEHRYMDYSGVSGNSMPVGQVSSIELKAEELYKNPATQQFLPNIDFFQGNYYTTTDTIYYNDTIPSPAVSLLYYEVSDLGFICVDTIYKNESGYCYVYKSDEIVDSIYFDTDETIYNNLIGYYDTPFEIIDKYEIGRFITPYGINFDLGPNGFKWVYDVTDYAFLLHDFVDISSGNQQELIDIRFVMIEGTPQHNLLEFDKIWGDMACYTYYNLDSDIDLSEIKHAVNPEADYFKIKSRLTGHGHNSSSDTQPHCCEWKNNTHYLKINGEDAIDWHIWKYTECGTNPTGPQGGTWPYAREGWCPGDMVKDYEFDISEFVTGDSVAIDYDITDIPANNPGQGGGNYVMAMHLFQYDDPNYNIDAEIYDVLKPNNYDYYKNVNPICYDPEIIIRNAGAEPLNFLTINYYVSGGEVASFTWEGNLSFMEMERISLPVPNSSFWIGDTTGVFYVEISSPNGNEDQYIENNYYKTKFLLPDMYNENFIIEMKSNNRPEENSYVIKDYEGNTVREVNSFEPDEIYYDTLNLTPGCYTIEFFDTGDDGLAFWYTSNYLGVTNGYFKLKKPEGWQYYKTFDPDFGSGFKYAFSIVDTLDNSIIKNPGVLNKKIEVYPNPNKGSFNVYIEGFFGKIDLQIQNMMGQIIYNDQLLINGSLVKEVDIENKPGIYLVRVSKGDNIEMCKVLIE